MSGKLKHMWHSSPSPKYSVTTPRPLVDLREHEPARVGGVHLRPDPAKQLVGCGQVLARGPSALYRYGTRVEPEPVEAEIEPEPDDTEHRIDDLGVVVVQVRLLMEETVPVVLLAPLVEGPVGGFDVAEDHADIGEAVVVVGPHVPVGLWVVARRAGLDEPGVLVARVVHHEGRR